VQAGHNPNPSLGRRAPDPNSIDNYRPPRTRWPIWLAAGVVAFLLAVLGFIFVPPLFAPQETATPTPTSSVSRPPGGTEWESSTEGSTGFWSIDEVEWSASGYVDVKVTVECESGVMTYSFFAFGDNDSTATDSSFSDREPALSTGRLNAGDSASGWVRFNLDRGPSTLVLATSHSYQISALPIRA
jgi:hypothetical protein